MKEVYLASIFGDVGRGIYIWTYFDQIGNFSKKSHVRSTINRRTCLNRLINVDEAKEFVSFDAQLPLPTSISHKRDNIICVLVLIGKAL